MSIRWHGLYGQVLQQRCERELGEFRYRLVLTDATADELEAHERDYQERLAALVAQRQGEPVGCNSQDLPSRLPAPFEHRWGRPQLRFNVMPDDTIVW